MGTLLAEILNDQTIAPVSLPPLTKLKPLGAEIEISVYFDPGDRGLGFAIIVFGASKFTPSASHTFRRICNNKPIGLTHDDQRF